MTTRRYKNIRYRPHKQIIVRDNRFTTKSKVLILCLIIVGVLVGGAYIVSIAYTQGQDQCRRQNAMRLGQKVQQCFPGETRSLIVRCSDEDSSEENFICDIAPDSDTERIGERIYYLWNKKAKETHRTLCNYDGSNLLDIGYDTVSVAVDENGEYNFKKIDLGK